MLFLFCEIKYLVMKNDILKETYGMSYEDRMLYAFVGKPSKFDWYKKAFAKYSINGIEKVEWNWSWYAFFFNFFYLLYRKVYGISGLLFLFYLIFGSIGGIFGLILNIIFGGYLPFFVYKRYFKKKKDIEEHISNEDMRIETMAIFGGTNNAIIYIVIIFAIFLFFISLFYFVNVVSFISIVKSSI